MPSACAAHGRCLPRPRRRRPIRRQDAPRRGTASWRPAAKALASGSDPTGSPRDEDACAMKMIVAVIKPSRLDAVLDAVTEAGASGMTVTEVRGYGRQRGKTEVYRGAEYEVKLLPKVKLEIAVPSDIADAVVEAVARTANTGQIGDGKVFVMDLEQAL